MSNKVVFNDVCNDVFIVVLNCAYSKDDPLVKINSFGKINCCSHNFS